jgi:hypothetical protein
MAIQGLFATFKIPAGRVGVIRAVSYFIEIVTPGQPTQPFIGFEPLFGPYNFSLQVDGVAQEGLPILPFGATANDTWPQFIYDMEVFVICPEKSTVTVQFINVDTDLTPHIDVKLQGDLLPTHGFPPPFEIASMGNLGPMQQGV